MVCCDKPSLQSCSGLYICCDCCWLVTEPYLVYLDACHAAVLRQQTAFDSGGALWRAGAWGGAVLAAPAALLYKDLAVKAEFSAAHTDTSCASACLLLAASASLIVKFISRPGDIPALTPGDHRSRVTAGVPVVLRRQPGHRWLCRHGARAQADLPNKLVNKATLLAQRCVLSRPWQGIWCTIKLRTRATVYL